MKTLKLSILLLLIAGIGFSQKADFKASAKYSSTNLRKKVGSTSVRPAWLKDSEKFWYSYKTSEGNKWWFVDPDKKSKAPLFDNNYLSAELSKVLHKPFNRLDLPIKSLKFEDDNKSFKFEIDSFKFEYILKTNEITLVDTIEKKKDESADRWKSYSPDSTWITFSRNHNLYIMSADDPDSTEYQLTTDGVKEYSFGSSFGRGDDKEKEDSTKRGRGRVSWTKDSKKFYVTRRDSRKVEDLWVINVLTQPRPKLETYKYAMPGDEFVPQTELWIFDPEDKKGMKINLDKWKDQTLSPQLIGKRSDKILVKRTKRTVDELEILKIDTETGEFEVYLHEISKPYFHSSTR